MIDYKPTLVEKLNTIGLPVYYELFLTEQTEVPCLSYIEANSVNRHLGDTLGYDDLYFNIKVWSRSVKEMSEYALKVDEIMREAGFKRIASNELWMDTIGQKQLRYMALSQETYGGKL